MFFISIVILMLGVIGEDAFDYCLIQIGPMQIYLVDLAIFSTFIVILLNWRTLFSADKKSILLPLLILMGWVLVCIFKGIGSFSFSAIGEARIILPLFFFGVSYALIMRSPPGPSVLDSLGKLLALAALGVLIVFLLELSVGHRLTLSAMENPDLAYLADARGTRILGTLQSFTAGVFFIYVCVNILLKNKIPNTYKALGLVMPVILVVSMNRAVVISMVFGLVFYGLFLLKSGQRLKMAAIMGVTLMTVFLSVKYVFPERFDVLELLVVSAINPENETTGTWEWRMKAQYAAYQVFLENPIAGEGFGGYWDYYIDGLEIQVAPHNQYLLLLAKTGIIGLMLFAFVILAVLRNYLKFSNHIPNYARPMFDTMLIIVIASIPYGFAYGYVQTYGFYLGIFAGILHRTLLIQQNELGLAAGEYAV
jgi:O-antigen ligase